MSMTIRLTLLLLLTSVSSPATAQRPSDCGSDSVLTGHKAYSRFALLLFDYQTLAFEGGRISRVPALPAELVGLRHKIPVIGIYEAPHDFGSITFRHATSADTLFDATIVHRGRGGIRVPTSLADSQALVAAPGPLQDPEEIAVFWTEQVERIRAGTPLRTKAPEAVKAAQALGSIYGFGGKQYEAGAYLYAPAVGVFDPEIARWVVMLHAREREPVCRPRTQ